MKFHSSMQIRCDQIIIDDNENEVPCPNTVGWSGEFELVDGTMVLEVLPPDQIDTDAGSWNRIEDEWHCPFCQGWTPPEE